MAKLHSIEEAQKIREQILADPNRVHDHVRIEPVDGGKPGSSVRVLGRRHDNHLVEDEL